MCKGKVCFQAKTREDGRSVAPILSESKRVSSVFGKLAQSCPMSGCGVPIGNWVRSNWCRILWRRIWINKKVSSLSHRMFPFLQQTRPDWTPPFADTSEGQSVNAAVSQPVRQLHISKVKSGVVTFFSYLTGGPFILFILSDSMSPVNLISLTRCKQRCRSY